MLFRSQPVEPSDSRSVGRWVSPNSCPPPLLSRVMCWRLGVDSSCAGIRPYRRLIRCPTPCTYREVHWRPTSSRRQTSRPISLRCRSAPDVRRAGCPAGVSDKTGARCHVPSGSGTVESHREVEPSCPIGKWNRRVPSRHVARGHRFAFGGADGGDVAQSEGG